MQIGAHVGVASGYPQALDYAREVGAECVQVFAKSPRQWAGKALQAETVERFRQRRVELSIGSVVTHTAYLINLGTSDAELRAKSIAALSDELRRGALLGADAVITHVGTYGGTGLKEAAERIASAITEAFVLCGDANTRLLLENTAGAGTTFGAEPEEIGAVLDRIPESVRKMTGVCIDTCHAHAAGHDVSTESGWTELLGSIWSSCGKGSVGAIHANDCIAERGSHKDRHAWIGDGMIGESGFREMFCQQGLAGLPVITEMPGEVPVKDMENISRLKRLRDDCSGRA